MLIHCYIKKTRLENKRRFPDLHNEYTLFYDREYIGKSCDLEDLHHRILWV